MKKIVFIAGGALIAWGAYCWYRNDLKKQKPATAGATNGTAATAPGATSSGPELSSPAHQAGDVNELTVQQDKPVAELVISDQPLQPASMSDAVRYYDTNPAALYYRPRTTIAVDPQFAQDVITIDSANMYAR